LTHSPPNDDALLAQRIRSGDRSALGELYDRYASLALATALRGHPAVRGLRYPGLPDDPAHPVAARQMRRFGGLVSFELASAEAVAAFTDRTRLVTEATSFGGLHTSADRRARWGDDVPAGFVRLSAGCEDTADLVADLTSALDILR
jgi:cystathionine gamma-lyase